MKLITKVFIFSNKSLIIQVDILVAKNIDNLEAAIKLYKKLIVIKKFYNFIQFI